MPKFSQKEMERLFFNQKIDDSKVIKGPQFGEDAAVIQIDDTYLIVHPDPISGAVENIGWLSINIPANDIAVTGANPRWALPAIQVPDDYGEDKLERIVQDMIEAASSLNISLVGGHTETVDDIKRPLVTTNVMGITPDPIFTSDSKPGDLIVQINEAGIEGTWILASDYGEYLKDTVIREKTIEEARSWRNDISVVDSALKIRDSATSMHDPTEGGIIQGIYEMAFCSKNDFIVEEDVMIRPETVEICDSLGLDPLKLISSGCLIATVPKKTSSIDGKIIGRVEEGEGDVYYKGKKVEENPNDELFRAIKKLKK